MKAWSCALGCLGALAAGVVGIVGLALLGAWLESETPETPEAEAPRTPGFTRAEEVGGWALSFGFADHDRRWHQVSCRVQREDLESELAWFGFQEDALWGELNRQMEEVLDAEILREGVRDYYEVTVDGRGAYRWKWVVEGEVPEPEHSRAVSASRRVARWIEKEFPGRRRSLKAALVAPHGFGVDEDGDLVIDYPRLIDSGTDSLMSCQRALMEAGGGSSWRQYLGLFLAFFQDLEYEIPPIREEGRYTFGLWVPTNVGQSKVKAAPPVGLERDLSRLVAGACVEAHAVLSP